MKQNDDYYIVDVNSLYPFEHLYTIKYEGCVSRLDFRTFRDNPGSKTTIWEKMKGGDTDG